MGAIPALIGEHKIDVVVAAGDIFDSSNPDQKSIETLRDIFKSILAAGAKLMVTSGNHDSATRLSLAGAFSAGSGLHLFTEVSELMNPIELTDAHGAVDFYGIPFIEPKLHRDHAWMPENSLDQHSVISAAMDQGRARIKKRADKGRRSVVISHTFAAGAENDSSDSERAITRDNGGLATIRQELSFPGVPLEWVFKVGDQVTGSLDLEDNVLIPSGSQQSIDDVVAAVGLGNVTL